MKVNWLKPEDFSPGVPGVDDGEMSQLEGRFGSLMRAATAAVPGPTVRKSVDKGRGVILGKLEFMNPTSSVKDRIAISMIDEAEKSGQLKPGGTIVEPTSGNTGLGLAMVAAARGYKLIIAMPETMSVERRVTLEHLGADLYLTSGDKGMLGAVEEAEKIVANNKGAFMPQQFTNKANPLAHYKTTGPEIWDDTDGKVDILIAGVGTGGTLAGCGKYLKEKNPNIEIVAVEPENSAVLSGGVAGKHVIQGIGAGFIPEVLDVNLLSEVVKVSDEDAINTAKLLAKEEGIFCGISAGANVFAAKAIAEREENIDKVIVTIICDTGERYLSTTLVEK